MGKRLTESDLRKSLLVLVGDIPEPVAKASGLSETPKALATALTKMFEQLQLEAGKAHTDPSEPQKQAGNYRKGHVRMHGMDITIENPAGSDRTGTDSAGKQWSCRIKHHYGYIRGTEGKDGDHVDVICGPHPDTELAFVVNQVSPADGSFDEHKAVLGARSAAEAKELYHGNYSDGWKGFGGMKAMHMSDFRRWLQQGKRTKPV